MEHIHDSQVSKKAVGSPSQVSISHGWFTGLVRAVTICVVVILVISAVSTGTAYASQSSLPGDTLYSVKLGTEQLQRIVEFDDAAEVELELKFASIRLDELEELVSMPADQAAMAIAGYERNLNKAITKAEKVRDGETSMETVALAILTHLERLDRIEDRTSENAREALINSKEVAINSHINALQNLAKVNPVRATDINLRAIQGRLERAEAEAVRGNSTGTEDALQEYKKLRRFGKEISNSAEERGQDTRAIDEMNARATTYHLESLGSIYGNVSQETKGAVEQAMGVAIEEHGQAVQGLQQQGAQGDIPTEPSIPNDIPDDVKKNIQEAESKGSGKGRS